VRQPAGGCREVQPAELLHLAMAAELQVTAPRIVVPCRPVAAALARSLQVQDAAAATARLSPFGTFWNNNYF
jgi:hypothetical protein